MMTARHAVMAMVAVGLLSGGLVRAQNPADIAARRESPVVLSATIAVEATDNRDSVARDKQSNVDLYVVPRIDLVFDGGRSTLGLNYAPSLRLRSDAAPHQNDTEIYHRLGINAGHELSMRLRGRLDNRFDYTDDPSVQSGGATLRGDRSYLINRLLIGLNYDLLQASNVDLTVEHRIKRYDESAIARNFDEDELGVGVALRHQLTETLRLMGNAKAIQYAYDTTTLERDFDSVIVAAGVEYALSETLMATLTAGYQDRSYADSSQSSDGLPYVRALLKGSSGRLRMTGEVGHGLRNSDVYPFSSQDYTDARATVAVEVSGKLELQMAAVYSLSSYDQDQTPSGVVDADFQKARSGDRTTLALDLGAIYRMTETMSVNVAQRFEDVDSDVDESFTKLTTRLALSAWF